MRFVRALSRLAVALAAIFAVAGAASAAPPPDPALAVVPGDDSGAHDQ
jgi:hypothetical protein